MFRFIALFSLAFLISGAGSQVSIPKPKEILVIYSYASDFSWTATQRLGINNILGSDGRFKLVEFFLESKKIKDQGLLAAKRQLVHDYLHKSQPSFAILMDDAAMKFFYTKLHERKIPVSFGGINGDIEDYGYVAGHKNISGTMERYNYLAVMGLLKKIRPEIKTILAVSENNLTGTLFTRNLTNQVAGVPLETDFGLQLEHYIVEDYESLLKKITSEPMTTGILYLSVYSVYDRKGKHWDHDFIRRSINAKSRHVDAGIASFQMKTHDATLLSLGSSGQEIGQFAAGLIVRSISEQIRLDQIPIRQVLPLKLELSKDRSDLLDITFPFDVLSYATNVNDFDKELQNDPQ